MLTVLIWHQGCITNSSCTAVRWVPSSPTLFLVSHADGTIIVYDKEREDGIFSPQEPTAQSSAATSHSEGSSSSIPSEDASSQGQWNPLDTMFVTMPRWHPVTAHAASTAAGGRPDKDKTTKNPVSHWKVARRSVVGTTLS